MNKDDLLSKILNLSFVEIKDIVSKHGNKEKIRQVLDDLENKIVEKFYERKKIKYKLPLNIVLDVLKFVKIKHVSDEEIENVIMNEKTLLFRSLVFEKEVESIPLNVFYIKSRVFQNCILKLEHLKYLDIGISIPGQLKRIISIRSLVGCRFHFDCSINEETIFYLNDLIQIKNLYIHGKVKTRKPIELKKLETLELFGNCVSLKNLNVSSIKFSNTKIPKDYLSSCLELRNLNKIEFVKCILPPNILNVFSTKVRYLKIIECKSDFEFNMNVNFFVEKVHIQNFDFSIKKNSEQQLKIQFKNILRRYLKNVHPINFFFDFG
jgi:hypothetical protein